MNETHIPKHTFFDLIRKRLMRYMDAIWGRGCWSPNVASAIHYNCEKMQRLQIADDYLGNKFWGYGINRICDGQEWHKLLDIQEIEKLTEPNKHHQPYRFLGVLTFKVQEESLYVSTFVLDSVSVGVEARMNSRYFLRNFDNARVTTINNKLHIEFIFQNALHPITFQLDDYYVPGHLDSESLAQYYIEAIKKEAQKWQVPISPAKNLVDERKGNANPTIEETKKSAGGNTFVFYAPVSSSQFGGHQNQQHNTTIKISTSPEFTELKQTVTDLQQYINDYHDEDIKWKQLTSEAIKNLGELQEAQTSEAQQAAFKKTETTFEKLKRVKDWAAIISLSTFPADLATKVPKMFDLLEPIKHFIQR